MTGTTIDRPLVGSGTPVSLPGLPAIPGLVVRHWRDASDIGPFVAVVNASWAADGVAERSTIEHEENELRFLNGHDIARDLLLVEIDGTVVGWARVNSDVDDDGVHRHWVSVMLAPAGRGRGLDRALLDWCEARQRERVAEAGAAAGGGVVERRLGAWAAAREVAWIAALEERGYAPIRYFTDMVRPDLDDLPDRPLPDGLEVREVTPETIRAVIAAEDEAFRDHWGHHASTEADIVGLIEHPHTDPSLWVVAWDGEEVAGLVMGSLMHGENAAFGWRRGWLGAVATRRPWRGRGLASALMVRAIERLRDRGLTSVALGVDTENPYDALGLYERLGFRAQDRYVILFKPFTLLESA